MKAEIKCPSCARWVSNEGTHCPYCGSVLDRNVLLKEERAKRAIPETPKKKSRIELFLDRTENSDKPFVILFRKVVAFFWAIYMAILAFIVWLVTVAAG
jgi:hypothetical protein